jgi:hypothetical protein
MTDDYGKADFKEIGVLSSQLPAYVRHCCRSIHDGTDDEVLDAFRVVSYTTLQRYADKYPFAREHMELMRYFEPAMVKKIILKNNSNKMLGCLATNTSQGLPKRACLHCPKVGLWLKLMKKAGTIDEKTGERIDYK